MADASPPVLVDRALRVTPLITVGEFQCSVSHPRFEDSGRIRQDCFVFPRLAVTIEHEHEAAFVANTTVITFYNEGQSYRRAPISAEGDRCDWFGVTRELALDIVTSIAPSAADRPGGPFSWSRGPADAQVCFDERDFIRRLQSGGAIDDAAIEERIVWWLAALARASCRDAEPRSGPLTRRTRHAVHDVERMLSRHWCESWALADLARGTGLSVFHLCRAFRRVTGRTIHEYREALRLRAALDVLQSGGRPVTEIALDAGFSSHSHFTAAFHRAFGRTPSVARGVRGR
jgi:AraC-like DNA-binding protein